MFINAEALKVLGQRRLDPFVQSRKIWPSILLDLSLESVQLLDLIDVIGDLHAVVVDLCIDRGPLNHQAFGVAAVRDENGEVAVVFGLRAAFLIVAVLLLVRKLLVVRDRLSVDTHKKSARRAN